ncbi:phosphotransferase enzyme family protein [Brachybacterium kimchii]|uniref:phosphotransferase enzyme family protein n=1 Tax=Brachybacterium kimchii TaxID=2942909 RepID=UPI003D190775
MVNREILIEGSTVGRPRKPWTETVHAFLEHLRSRDVPVPRPLALDEQFEYVSLVDGLGGDDAWTAHVTSEAGHSMGQLLRRVHDAAREWSPPDDACWSVPHTPSGTICHGDPKPANFAWRNGRAVGLFDWDAARPAEPVNDLAYALLWSVPVRIRPMPERTASEQLAADARAAALLEGYGWEGPFEVAELAIARHRQAINEVEWLGSHDHEPHASWVREGWPDRWRRELRAVRP